MIIAVYKADGSELGYEKKYISPNDLGQAQNEGWTRDQKAAIATPVTAPKKKPGRPRKKAE